MFCASCGTEVEAAASFCQACGTKTGAGNSESSHAQSSSPSISTLNGPSAAESDKLMALLTHLGGIFFGLIPSLIVYLLKKDSPGWVLDNAREALNWQITVFIGAMVCVVLMFVLIGIFLLWALMLANLVFCILATVAASNKQTYRYPLSLRLLK
jgi:uncharacterized Tic20 family protein